MNNEFKKTSQGEVTRYVLESASGGGTSAGGVASVSMPIGGTRKRGDNLIAQEGDKITVPVTQKPRLGPLRPQTGGGAHRDKKKEQKQGTEKHKKSLMPMESELLDKEDLQAKRKALQDLSMEKGVDKRAVQQRKLDLEKEASAKGMAEDHEIQMASSELQSIAKNAVNLLSLVRRYSEKDGLDAWQQSKITKAADYLNAVLQSISGEQGTAEGYFSDQDVEKKDRQYAGTQAYHAKKKAEKEKSSADAKAAFNAKFGGDNPANALSIRKKGVAEAPIEMDPAEPMNPMIHNHQGANPAKLQYRMARAAAQFKELAKRAENGSAIGWESIARQFGELAMNVEQIKHGLDELAAIRKKGGRGSRGIDPNIGEQGVAEISDTTKSSYKEKATQQVKDLKPHAKSGEYRDIAKNMIARREKGLARVSEDEYMMELAGKLAEKIPANAPADVWVKDFQKANPNKYHQFKNKTPAKKAQMAVAASYAAKNPSKKK